MDTATLRRIYVYDIQQTDTRVKGTESSAQTNERNTPTTECTQHTHKPSHAKRWPETHI